MRSSESLPAGVYRQLEHFSKKFLYLSLPTLMFIIDLLQVIYDKLHNLNTKDNIVEASSWKLL